MNPDDTFGTYPDCQAALAHHQAMGIVAFVFCAILIGAAITFDVVTRPKATWK